MEIANSLTQVTVSIFYDSNHYTTNVSLASRLGGGTVEYTDCTTAEG